ncbi:hypothetical protein SESBI_49699 [Sesbania bispinosa]|nr:hypothetical protein SESBI_49699 [Sesbania bispinosa]
MGGMSGADLGLPAVDENHAAPDDQPIEMPPVNGVPVVQGVVIGRNSGAATDLEKRVDHICISTMIRFLLGVFVVMFLYHLRKG